MELLALGQLRAVGAVIDYDLVLSPLSPKSPRLLGVDYNYSDIGWSTMQRYYVMNSSLPLTVSSIRVNVEARPYVQTAVHRGSCSVPAGQTSCVIANSFTMAKGTTGYVHDNATVYNADSTLQSNPLWAEVNWNDQYYPNSPSNMTPIPRSSPCLLPSKGGEVTSTASG